MSEGEHEDDWHKLFPGDTLFYSPSQVEAFIGCPSKWAWRKIARVHVPANQSAALGTECHGQAETYLDGGSLDFTRASGYIIAAGLHELPEPRTPGVKVEGDFYFQSPRTKFVWNGRIDLSADDSAKIPGCAGGVPGIVDHKTTSNLRWAKTEEDLRWDVQANVYAYATMAKWKAPTVDLKWVYYQTKGAKASKVTHLRVVSSHAAKVFRAIEDTALEMSAFELAARKTEDKDGYILGNVPKNVSACSDYGGCPYEYKCNITPLERAKSAMSASGSLFASLKSTIKERVESEDAKTSAAPEPKIVVAPPMFASRTGTPPNVGEVPATLPAWATAAVDPLTQKKPAAAVVMPGQINPPESVGANAPVITAGGPSPEPMPAAEPKKRGRPKKSTTPTDPIGADVHMHTTLSPSEVKTLDELAATQEIHAAAPEPVEFPASSEPSAIVAASGNAIGMLFIDCAPIGLNVPSAEQFIKQAKAIIREDQKVDDYRFIKFGEGSGMLAVATRKAIEDAHPAMLTLFTNSHEGMAIASELASVSAVVVRGMR